MAPGLYSITKAGIKPHFLIMMTRRQAVKTLGAIGAAGAAAAHFCCSEVNAANPPATAAAPRGPFQLPPLPYPTDSLEPHIDARTMEIHHGNHHAAYIANLNK